jgi:hypothetical protein
MNIKNYYIPGGYRRRALKGYLQHEKFIYKTIHINIIKGRDIFRDSFMDHLYEKGLLKKSAYLSYYENLRKLFKNSDFVDQLTDEQLYYSIYDLKKDFFDAEIEKYLKNERKKEVERILSKIDEFQTPDDLIMEMMYYDVEKERRDLITPINDIKKMTKSFKSNDHIVFIPGNYKQLPFLLSFLKYLKNKNIEILVKNDPVDEEPSYADVEYFMKRAEFPKFKVTLYSSTSYGIDLADESLKPIFFTENENSKLVIGLDENMMLTLDGAPFDYYILSKVESAKARRYTNLYVNSSKTIPFVIAHVKGGSVVAKRYSGVERTIGSLYHYHTNGDKSYYMNFYSTTYSPDNFKEFDITSDSFPQIVIERDENLSKEIKLFLDDLNATYIDSYYSLDNLKKVEYIPEKDQNAVLVRGIHFKDTSKVNIFPTLAQNLNSDLLYVRDMLKDGFLKENGLYFNFLYFATSNIVRLYNDLRNENERLHFENFFIDYIHEDKFTTFPLYNKAYIECAQDGKISIHRKKLGGGTLTVNGLNLKWSTEDVNSFEQDKDVIVFTPYMNNEKLSREEVNFRRFTTDVGHGRYNIVLVNNEIICVRRGSVKQPSLGVVISLNEKMFNEFAKAVEMAELEDGYFKVGNCDIFVELNDNKESRWAFGGGSLLVKDEENLVENSNKAFESFAEEGWYHPLSMQTQETQVQEWVRGPRTLIGTDKNGGLFVLVFSGRTKESKGIRFDEAVEISKKEIGNLKDVMNLDGGASSCLGFIYKNEFFEVSYPSASDDTSAGLVRPVNSAIFVTRKRDNGSLQFSVK